MGQQSALGSLEGTVRPLSFASDSRSQLLRYVLAALLLHIFPFLVGCGGRAAVHTEPSSEASVQTDFYRTALAQDPSNDEIRGKLARTLALSGEYTESEKLYREILIRQPGNRDIKTALARVKAWQGQYGLAQDMYEEILAAHPGEEEARRGLADVLYWKGDFASALAQYEQLAVQRPSQELARQITKVRAAQDSLSESQLLRAPFETTDKPPRLPFRNYIKAGYSQYPYTNNIKDERHYLLEGAHAFGNQTAVLRVEPTSRFGLNDVPLSGELYSTLWKRAWGYLAGSVTPNARFMPDYSAGGEIYQGLKSVSSFLSFLEASFGYRHLQFKSTGVDLLMPGIIIYLPHDIWITEKVYFVPTTGAITLSSMLTWRPTDRVQMWFSGAFGTAGERIFAEQDFVRVSSTIFQAGIVLPLSDSFSAEVVGLYEDRGFLYTRQGGTINLLWHY